MFDEPLILETDRALLRPVEISDFDAFKSIAFHEDIWRYMTVALKTEEELKAYLDKAVTDRANKVRHAFTVIDKHTGHVAGSTSYGNINLGHSRLEIGWTWLGKAYHGKGLNRHCKFLLLQYAFEQLNLERVEFKTDAINPQSRKALKKIGGVEEGILRSHTIMQDGRRRNTIYYSILKPEWETVKENIFLDLKSI